jgi:hypothetical protein
VCTLGVEVGDDAGLPIGTRADAHAGLAARPRLHAVGADDQSGRYRSPIVEPQLSAAGSPGDRRRSARRDDVEPGHAARDLDQCGIELAALDDPRQRALAELVGREFDPAACVSAHVHRFDRSNALDRQQLPRAERVQERRAARTDGVDALITAAVGETGLGSGDIAAVDEGDAQTGSRQRRGQCEADQARADDDHVARICICAHPSTSIT